MNKHTLPLVAFSALALASCSTMGDNDKEGSNDTTIVVNDDAGSGGTGAMVRTQLSESDSYIDLRTGNPVRIRRSASGLYTADAGDLGLYVNTNTGDTFYGGEAYRVNGHLMRGTSGDWDVDPTWLSSQNSADGMINDPEKITTEEDGDYKMKYKEGDVKEKLKVDGDGKDVKYKYKDDEADTKIKMTEDQIKIKDPSGKTEIESDGSIKTKPR